MKHLRQRPLAPASRHTPTPLRTALRLLVAASMTALAAPAAAENKGSVPSSMVVMASNPGTVPDPGGTGCGVATTPLDLQFDVPDLAGRVLEDLDVSLTFAPAHPWGGDLSAVLISPDGRRQRTLFGRTGATTAAGCGDSSDLLGPYVFSDAATPPQGGWWQAATVAGASAPVDPGSYFPTDRGGVGAVNPMPATPLASMFAGMRSDQATGTWRLRVSDTGAGDSSAVSAASLSLHLRAPTSDGLIHSNGVIDTGTLSSNGVAAPAGARWSELQPDADNPGTFNSLAGMVANDTSGSRLADDFVVPAGETWTLSGVALLVYATGADPASAPIVSATLRIWDGAPGEADSAILCGDDTTDRLLDATPTGLMRIFNAAGLGAGVSPPTNRAVWRAVVGTTGGCDALSFGPGRYWIDWSSAAVDDLPHFYPTNTYIEARTLPGDNARQFLGGAWSEIVDGGSPASAIDVPLEIPFQLLGIIGPQTPEVFADGFEDQAIR